MVQLFREILPERSLPKRDKFCESEACKMVGKEQKESERVFDKSTASITLYCDVKSRNVLPLESRLYASEMITRAV